MPTTPPRSTESDGVRSPRRTAPVTGVPSANSGHCSAIPITVTTLWEPAASCADVPGAAPAIVLPTPRTSSATEPSIGMSATLECGPGLDQSKTPTCRTLDALPHQRGGRYPQQGMPRRPQEPQRHRRDLREIRTSLRMTATPGAMLSTAPQCTFYSRHPLHAPDLGRRRRL